VSPAANRNRSARRRPTQVAIANRQGSRDAPLPKFRRDNLPVCGI